MEWWEFEELMSLADVANRYRPHKSATTVWRWCTDGVKGIKLEHHPAGCRLYTSWEAVQRFEAALAAQRAAKGQRPKGSGPTPPIAAAPARPAAKPASTPTSARAAAAGRKLAQLARL